VVEKKYLIVSLDEVYLKVNFFYIENLKLHYSKFYLQTKGLKFFHICKISLLFHVFSSVRPVKVWQVLIRSLQLDINFYLIPTFSFSS